MPQAAGGQTASGNRLGVLGNRTTLDTPFNLTGYTAQYVADSQSRSIADVVAADPRYGLFSPERTLLAKAVMGLPKPLHLGARRAV